MRFNDFVNKAYPLLFSTSFPDLEQAHKYADEFYRVHCPAVLYRELNREASLGPHKELAALWQEPVGVMQVSRDLTLRVFPEFSTEERQVHRKHATEIERDVRFSFGILELKRNDLYPEMGDHVSYGGYDYELRRVYIRPDALWMNTNQPLHISADAVIYRPGDKRVLRPDKEIG